MRVDGVLEGVEVFPEQMTQFVKGREAHPASAGADHGDCLRQMVAASRDAAASWRLVDNVKADAERFEKGRNVLAGRVEPRRLAPGQFYVQQVGVRARLAVVRGDVHEVLGSRF